MYENAARAWEQKVAKVPDSWSFLSRVHKKTGNKGKKSVHCHMLYTNGFQPSNTVHLQIVRYIFCAMVVETETAGLLLAVNLLYKHM